MGTRLDVILDNIIPYTGVGGGLGTRLVYLLARIEFSLLLTGIV